MNLAAMTLADRCAVMVAHANVLTQFMPFTIVRLKPDAVDERVGLVLIRHDDGTERESVMMMHWLCPATVAEAATRAWVYATSAALEDDDEAAMVPTSAVTGVLH